MKTTIIYLILILNIIGCSNFSKTSNDSNLKIDFQELGYGICETKTIYNETMKNSPSGNHIISTGFTLIEQTDRIHGKIGQKFGVEFNMKSNITKEILIEQVWIFPKLITDDNGKTFNETRYMVEKYTNEKTYSTYTLEKDYEIVKGEWVYQMFYNGKKLYERKFYID